jgi:predicted unusual protein kinase regulating ubiquinone biosynthesis (AarF/ABC1/UbiB family)
MKEIIPICNFFSIIIYSYLYNYLFLNCKEQHYEYCILNIAKLNMLFVKIMQWISCEDYDENIGNIIKNFSDNVPFDNEEVNYKQITDIEDYFKRNNINFTVDDVPINSGTMAIVYSGKLDDKNIVIKQLRNGVKESLQDSIKFMELLGEIFEYLPFFYMFRLKEAIHINKNALLQQVDFKKEIENQEYFKNKNKEFDSIVVPEIYYYDDICFRDIIIMDKLEGKKLHKISTEDKYKYCESYNTLLINSMLKNFILHSDLHIGNVIFLEEGKIGIIDFGYVLKFNKELSDKVFKFYKFLFNKQIKKLTNFILTVLCLDIDPNKNVETVNKLAQQKINNLFNDENLFSGKRALTLKDLIELNDYVRSLGKKVNNDFFMLALALGPSTTINAILKKDQPNNTLKNVFNKYVFTQIPENLKDY